MVDQTLVTVKSNGMVLSLERRAEMPDLQAHRAAVAAAMGLAAGDVLAYVTGQEPPAGELVAVIENGQVVSVQAAPQPPLILVQVSVHDNEGNPITQIEKGGTIYLDVALTDQDGQALPISQTWNIPVREANTRLPAFLKQTTLDNGACATSYTVPENTLWVGLYLDAADFAIEGFRLVLAQPVAIAIFEL